MTNEEALSVINNTAKVSARTADILSLSASALSLAAEALEKRIPKKPIEKESPYIGRYNACPSCGDTLSIFTGRYCTRCGQRLKWSEAE